MVSGDDLAPSALRNEEGAISEDYLGRVTAAIDARIQPRCASSSVRCTRPIWPISSRRSTMSIARVSSS